MRSIILAFVFLSCVSYTLADEDTVKASKLLLAAITGANPQASGVGGGTECAACTVLVAMAEQLAYIHDKPLLNVMQDFCAKLPIGVKQACDAFVNLYGDVIINLIELEETPDYVCQQLGVCTATCHLFPEPLVPPAKRDPTIDWSSRIPKRPDNWVGLELIDRSLSGFANEHLPLFDIDGDKFSDWKTLRGASWRGRDCDDLKKTVYPGRKNSTWPAEVDHNCNGIFGVNLQGESYEEILCSGTKYYGQAILGDSAAAHFHVPPEWVTPAKIANTTFDDLLPILANELDWPEMSATTGYTYNGWQGHPKGPVVSSYLKGLNNNRCTFRDYQNIGVNGARTSSMASNIMFSFARNQTLDLPINLMYALIGNDVCNPHPGFSHMTTPEEFYTNVVTAMNYLDTQLPMGSHVVFMGLADGLVLWDAMHARIHPIGELRQDVTYADLYDYLNCLEISPCWGWMNSDPFARNETQRIADQLSAVYHEVIKNNTYIHFNMTYIDCPVREIFDGWVAAGGQPWELVEPVDGFHPNQISNALIAEYVWNLFVNKYPYLIPPVNPNNEEILRLFGDQGGY